MRRLLSQGKKLVQHEKQHICDMQFNAVAVAFTAYGEDNGFIGYKIDAKRTKFYHLDPLDRSACETT